MTSTQVPEKKSSPTCAPDQCRLVLIVSTSMIWSSKKKQNPVCISFVVFIFNLVHLSFPDGVVLLYRSREGGAEFQALCPQCSSLHTLHITHQALCWHHRAPAAGFFTKSVSFPQKALSDKWQNFYCVTFLVDSEEKGTKEPQTSLSVDVLFVLSFWFFY